eukprot:2783670-Pleurochrysis_carterae.AAC.1
MAKRTRTGESRMCCESCSMQVPGRTLINVFARSDPARMPKLELPVVSGDGDEMRRLAVCPCALQSDRRRLRPRAFAGVRRCCAACLVGFAVFGPIGFVPLQFWSSVC